jgi:hypothetical protein
MHRYDGAADWEDATPDLEIVHKEYEEAKAALGRAMDRIQDDEDDE